MSILSILLLVLTVFLAIAMFALYKLWKRVKHYGEDQEINMTRSNVTQSNFPDGQSNVAETDAKTIKD